MIAPYIYRLSAKQSTAWRINFTNSNGLSFRQIQIDHVEHVAGDAPFCIIDEYGEEVYNSGE